MSEIQEIIKAYDQAKAQQVKTALATVVYIEGSAYRKPGARMLITATGQITGAISGGCLEEDVMRRAAFAIMKGHPMLVSYDTTDKADATLGLRLGCNGSIHVLIEPIKEHCPDHAIELLRKTTNQRRPAVIATNYSVENRNWAGAGTHLLFTNTDIIPNGDISETIKSRLLADAKVSLEQKRSTHTEYTPNGDTIFSAINYIPPPIRLAVGGAGYDVLPLIKMASILGWEIQTVSRRLPKISEKISRSCQIFIAGPESVFQKIAIDDRTAVVLMSHNYEYDKAVLRQLLKREFAYVGLLGPRSKLGKILAEFQQEGLTFPEAQITRIHNPVGLNIGAETAEEIALSIVAEIQHVFSGRRKLESVQLQFHNDNGIKG